MSLPLITRQTVVFTENVEFKKIITDQTLKKFHVFEHQSKVTALWHVGSWFSVSATTASCTTTLTTDGAIEF